MKIKPVVTEKALLDSKDGKYSFWVEAGATKDQIKKCVGEVFGVHVRSVHTVNYAKSIKKNYMGKKVKILAKKKAIVTLNDKETIDIFEEKKKKK